MSQPNRKYKRLEALLSESKPVDPDPTSRPEKSEAIELKKHIAELETQLSESEARYQLLSEAAIEGVVIHDKGILLDANETFATMFGYEQKEVIGMSAMDFLTPETREITAQNIRSGYEKPYDVMALRKDGLTFPVEITGKAIPYQGRTVRVTALRDITERKQLEAQVQEAFERRGYQVQISTEISQEVAAASQLDDLFDRVVTLTKERLGYYHTQLLRYDHARDAVVLINGYGEIGQKMLAGGHQMPMGKGLIGTAAASGETVLRPTLADDPDWHSNPLLPDTQGEIAVPIKWQNTVLGVLDVQSDQAGALSDEDRLLFEGLCGQIAIAMHSTELVEAIRQNEAKLAEALRTARLANWEYDFEKEVFIFNDQFYSIFHTTAEKAGGYQLSSARYAELFVHPDDLEFVRTVIGRSLSSTERSLSSTERVFNNTLDHRIIYEDGGIGYITVKSTVERDENGKITRYYGANQDITERKLAEEALRINEARLAEALQIARLAYWEYDVEKELFTFNDQFYALFHTTAEKVGGYQMAPARYSKLFVHPDDVEIVGSEIGKGMSSTERVYKNSIDSRILYADGGVGHMQVNITFERDENGKIIRNYGANQDITERIEVQHELAERLEEAEQQRADADKLYEIGQKISVAKDRQEIVAAVAQNLALPEINRAVLLNYEYNETGQVENVVFTANWHSGHGTPPTPVGNRLSTKIFTAIDNLLGTNPLFVGDTQRDERVDPATKAVFNKQNIRAFIALPVWDDIHQIGSLMLQSEDLITFTGKELTPYLSIVQQLGNALENQELFEQIQKRAEQLEAVATLSTTASTVLDPDQLLQAVVDLTKERFNIYHAHIYLADDSWNTLLLAAGAGEIGKQMVDSGHAIPMDAEKSLVARAARELKSVIVNDVRAEVSFLPNNMLPETRSEMAVPMIIGNKLIGVFDVQADNVGHFTDEDASIYTTLAAQVAVALQNARLYMEQSATVTQLRELDRLKSSFLANMSHELRTPLNSILGFADVMLEELDGPLTENMNNDLSLIHKNGQHLLHLINDVLDMAKIESGKMNLNIEKFNLQEVIEEVTSITSTLASEKNLALFIEPDSDHEVEIHADKIRLRQILINLINNSIKFTDTGKISIHVTREPNNVLIRIKDTGIGIPVELLESVFQEFTQVDTTTTRKTGGTGLGLPISRRLVNMHGGRLWAESTGVNGEGSTFYVHLPIEAKIIEEASVSVK